MNLVNKFIDTLEKRKYHRDEFYDLFLDYVDNNNIKLSQTEESELESKAYRIARERGYAGYDITLSLSEITDFKNKLDDYIKQTGSYLFHFVNERDDERLLSLSEVWEKYFIDEKYGGICINVFDEQIMIPYDYIKFILENKYDEIEKRLRGK